MRSSTPRRLTFEQLHARRLLAVVAESPTGTGEILPASDFAALVHPMNIQTTPVAVQQFVGPLSLRPMGEHMNSGLSSHEPFLADFSAPEQTMGRRVIHSSSDGLWTDQFDNLSPDDVVVIDHDVTFNSNANVYSVVVSESARLRFDPTGNQSLAVVNLQILASGRLEIGTPAQPHQGKVEIVFRDEPFDFELDPGQYGHGLIVLGSVTMHGQQLEHTFASVQDEILAGDSQLRTTGGQDWQVDDQILVPDSRQLFYTVPTVNGLDRYEVASLKSANANGIDLDQAIEFSHLGGRDSHDNLIFSPYVANLSRNIVLRSENPQGVRGHTIYIERAEVDIRYVEFVDLGRTVNSPVDNTVFDEHGMATKVGTNQTARYPVHFHHLVGASGLPADQAQFRFTGNSVHHTTQNNLRWGVVLHGSHYGLVDKNVVYNMAGAGIVTEDGTESFNVIRENFVSRISGTRNRGKFSIGDEGSGFWFKRPNNYVDGNVVTGADKAAYAVYGGDNVAVPAVAIPAFKGANPHAGEYHLVHPKQMHLLSFNGNEAYASHMGLELWYLGFKTYYDPADEPVAQTHVNKFDAWNINFAGVFGEQANNVLFENMRLINSKLMNDPNSVSRGFEVLRVKDVTIVDSTIENYSLGVIVPTRVAGLGKEQPIEDIAPFHLRDLKLRNLWLNIVFRTPGEDAIGAAPPRYTLIENVDFNDDPLNIPRGKTDIGMWYDSGRFTNVVQRDLIEVVAFDRDPRSNFQLYYKQQAPDFVVPISDLNGPSSPIGAPVAGLTNAQLWDQFGMAIAGAVAPGGVDSGSRLTYPSVDGLAFPLTRAATGVAILSISPDTGPVGDRRTAAQEIVVSGVGNADTSLVVYDGEQLLGRTTVNESGLWSLDLSGQPLAAGRHRLVAHLEDGSSQSDIFEFDVLIDTPKLHTNAVSIREDVPRGTVVQSLTATDSDPGERLRFEITSGNDSGTFSIDAQTGFITLARAELSSKDRSSYALGLRVTDSVGLIDQAVLEISVTPRPPGFWVTQLDYSKFGTLTPQEIVFLTRDQIATIPDSYWLWQIPHASRQLLSGEQLQGLRVTKAGMLPLLTPSQRSALSDAQLASLPMTELKYVPLERALAITPAQLAAIPDRYWFVQLGDDLRGSLGPDQVNAVPLSKGGMLGLLSQSQIDMLTVDSIQRINYYEFSYLSPTQIVKLSRDQLRSIPDGYWYSLISPASRNALAELGIRWSHGIGFVFP